jgi:hypothetical protein
VGLQFLNPLYLLGALAAAVPIVIHLINRRRAPVHRFPAIAYLLGARKKRARQFRLRHLLLLALRVAALVLLALALARPFLAVDDAGAKAALEPAQAVVIVDTSMSMGLKGERGDRLEAARRAVLKAVDDLGPGPRLAVLTTEPVPERPDGKVEPAKPLTLDLGTIRREIEALRVGYGEADFKGALRRAYARLAESPWGRREIILAADLARHGWEPVSRLALGQIDAGVGIRILDVGLPEAANVAVVGVTPPAGPLAEGVIARVGARVANFGGEPRGRVLVQLLLDGRKVDQKLVDVPARGEVETGFAVPLGKTTGAPGLHAGAVQVAADALPQDDAAYFAFESVGKLDVVVVDGDPKRTLLAAESFYLAQALDPDRDSQGALILPRVLTVDELARTDLAKTRVVYLLNAPSLPEGARRQLAAFVERGGGLVIAAGDQMDPAAATRELYLSGTRLLPGPLEPPRALGGGGARIKVAAADHPALAPFAGDAARLLGSARVLAVMPVRPPQNDPLVRTVLALEDGTPLLVERKQGAGRLLYLATTADLAWTDLPARAAFLPLVQALTLSLAVSQKGAPEPAHTVGTPFAVDTSGLPAGAVVRITDPRGTVHALSAPATEFQGVAMPGVYRVEMPGRVSAFAAAVPRAESDVVRIAESELLAKLPRDSVRIEAAAGEERPADPSAGPIPGRQLDLSFYALAGMLLALATESLLGARR